MKYYKLYMDRQSVSPETHDRLLELTAPRRRSVPRWAAGAAALAACCALCLGLWRLTGLPQEGGQMVSDSVIPGQKDTYGPGETPPGEQGNDIVVEGPDGAALDFFALPYIAYPELEEGSAVDVAPAALALPAGYFEEELTLSDLQTIFWGPAGKPADAQGDLPWMLDWGGYSLSGRACYDGEGALLWLYVFGEHPDGPSFTLELRPGTLPVSCLVEPDRATTDVWGVEVTGWGRTYDRDGDGVEDSICGSEFMAGEVGVRFETVVPANAAGDPGGASRLFNTLLVRQALSQDGGLSLEALMTAEKVPAWRMEEFSSLEEARTEAAFAPYLPRTAPDGYGEFSGRLEYQEGNYNLLWARWSRNYQDVEVMVRLPEGEESTYYQLVDPNEPETYDKRVYSIPWADSVPEEYRETVDHPMFRAEDMSREIVEARAHFKTEQGEPDAWVIDFAVLHPDGAVVEYSCEGLTPEQVWTMVEDTQGH